MLDISFDSILYIILITFALISIYQDVKSRKVSNYVTISFLYFSFLSYVFFVFITTYLELILIFVAAGLSFLLYKKNVWGGADGKIFIGISIMLLSFKDATYFLNFIVNLLLIYSITITIISLIYTKKKTKKEFIKTFPYDYYLFYLLIIFIFVKGFLNRVMLEFSHFVFLGIITIVLIVILLSKYLNKFYYKISKNKRKLLTGILLIFFIFININTLNILLIFVIIYIIRFLIKFISDLSGKIEYKNETYYSPFVIYLFLSALFTLIAKTNIILIIKNFF